MATALTLQSSLPLKDSSDRIPRIGFGVYRSKQTVCEASTAAALKAGYRHVDSAQFYRNEAQVGAAVANSGIPREDVYLTTKIMASGGSVEKSLQKCRDSVKKMDPRDGGYVDLFLIHSANVGSAIRKELWTALEQLKKEGLTKHIGVSNYGRGHIEEMKEYASVWPPTVNQIELHPWCQQREAVAYCKARGIVIEAYSPLARMQKAYDPTIAEIAKKHNKQGTQVLIRYCLQKGWIPLPKSDNPTRIEDNASVYDFELDATDMQKLDDLDEGAEGAVVQAVDNDL